MSDFAKKQLEKYGWSQGKGLGKLENGILCPVKAKLKFDNQGLGHDSVKELTSAWWYDLFNEASKSISVKKSESGVQLLSSRERTAPASTALVHKNFVKAESDKEDIKEAPGRNGTVVSDSFFSMCEGTRKTCSNYSLVKAKIKRVQKQEAAFEKRRRRTKLNKKKSF